MNIMKKFHEAFFAVTSVMGLLFFIAYAYYKTNIWIVLMMASWFMATWHKIDEKDEQ